MSTLTSIDSALQQLLGSLTATAKTESVFLLQAYDRILARDYIAMLDVPPRANSAMDGYVLNSKDFVQGKPFVVSQRIAAGDVAQPLREGTVARIFTGAEIPAGADTVIIQENCTIDNDKVIFNFPADAGDNIRAQGQDIAKGSLLFSCGHKLRPQDVALLASINIDSVNVFKKLRVAVLSTGNELVEPGHDLPAGKIYNSNRYLLAGLLQKQGCEFIDIGIVKDNLSATVEALTEAASADLIISSGGVSIGDEDYVKTAVEKLGAIQLWKLNIKPGKPFAFGHVKNTPFIGLPGNPVSAFVTFELLVKYLIQQLQGQTLQYSTTEMHPALFSIPSPRKRCEFLRARITAKGVELHPQQSSGALSSTVWANCLVRINEGITVEQGDMVQTYLLE